MLYGWGDSCRSANHPKICGLQRALVDIVKEKKCDEENKFVPPDHFCAGRSIAMPNEVNTYSYETSLTYGY